MNMEDHARSLADEKPSGHSDMPERKERETKKGYRFLKRWRLPSLALVAAVAVLVVMGTYYFLKPTDQSGRSAVINCNSRYATSHWAVTPLDGGVYAMQADEYNSGAAFSMCGDGDEDFKITKSQIDVPTYGAPGGFPSIFRGCHWGDCTEDSGLPIKVSSMETNTSQVRLSYKTHVSARGVWDDAFDIYFTPCDDRGISHSGCTQNTQSDREMMIWLSHYGPATPGGKYTEVTIEGIHFNLWWDGYHTMWYEIRQPTLTNPQVQNLDLGDFIKDAVNRGYIPSPSWYLMDIEAGFEIWRGGQGLQANSLSICTPSTAGCGSATRAAASLGRRAGVPETNDVADQTSLALMPGMIPEPCAWDRKLVS